MNDDVARAVLSGGYERRRGYLTNVLTAWNQLAVTGTIAIWAFLVRWDTLVGEDPNKVLFATQVAWAGALSSLLIGLWRLWARVVDNEIVRLYPAIYLSERLLFPAEVCTIRPPKDAVPLSRDAITSGFEYRQVQNGNFGGRGHSVFDWIGAGMIIAFAVISVLVAASQGIITFSCVNLRDSVVAFLVANVIGLTLIISGYWWWKQRILDWPVPRAIRNPAERRLDDRERRIRATDRTESAANSRSPALGLFLIEFLALVLGTVAASRVVRWMNRQKL